MTLETKSGGGFDGGTTTRSPKERLDSLIRKCFIKGSGKYTNVSSAFRDELLQDADLLWEFFHGYYNQAFSPLYTRIARDMGGRKLFEDDEPRAKAKAEDRDEDQDDELKEEDNDEDEDKGTSGFTQTLTHQSTPPDHSATTRATQKSLLSTMYIKLSGNGAPIRGTSVTAGQARSYVTQQSGRIRFWPTSRCLQRINSTLPTSLYLLQRFVVP
jgi:hypothetical protein